MDAALSMDDLRPRIAALLRERENTVAGDAVSIFPLGSDDPLDPPTCARVAREIARLLADGIHAGRIDPRAAGVGALHGIALERGVSIERLFSFVYLIERIALDELALDGSLGATSEAWPLVAQLVRRASFDLVAAYAASIHAGQAAVVDRLTTLYARPMFEAVVARELELAGRFGGSLALILFEVDGLPRIAEQRGAGVADRILERVGVTLRSFFRQHDWAARYGADRVAVLLTQTDSVRAAGLAETARETVEARLEISDHRDGSIVKVTLTVAVVSATLAPGEVIDRERLLAETDAAVDRARRNGRRLERVNGLPSRTPLRNSP